jgi:hypothetical protein
MSYDIFHGKENDAAALRQMAAECERRSEESFQRSDTDGFLSQWASDISAQQYRRQAQIAEHGGKAMFTGLYEGNRRVAAKIISQPAYNRPWATTYVWLLKDEEAGKFGRRFVPLGEKSRVQKALGLREASEMAPAKAIVSTGGRKNTGLSGCANAFVTTKRTGDEWGLDSELYADETVK